MVTKWPSLKGSESELAFKANMKHQTSPLPFYVTQITSLLSVSCVWSPFVPHTARPTVQCWMVYLLKLISRLTSLLQAPFTCKWNSWRCNFLLIAATEQRGSLVRHKHSDDLSYFTLYSQNRILHEGIFKLLSTQDVFCLFDLYRPSIEIKRRGACMVNGWSWTAFSGSESSWVHFSGNSNKNNEKEPPLHLMAQCMYDTIEWDIVIKDNKLEFISGRGLSSGLNLYYVSINMQRLAQLLTLSQHSYQNNCNSVLSK